MRKHVESNEEARAFQTEMKQVAGHVERLHAFAPPSSIKTGVLRAIHAKSHGAHGSRRNRGRSGDRGLRASFRKSYVALSFGGGIAAALLITFALGGFSQDRASDRVTALSATIGHTNDAGDNTASWSEPVSLAGMDGFYRWSAEETGVQIRIALLAEEPVSVRVEFEGGLVPLAARREEDTGARITIESRSVILTQNRSGSYRITAAHEPGSSATPAIALRENRVGGELLGTSEIEMNRTVGSKTDRDQTQPTLKEGKDVQ
ncbi:MAG: hypothetical protein HKN20_05355 [Gemmatimonadetes bacterium]|nr:hypothetical protein [Gemmatimonadota bacterium]